MHAKLFWIPVCSLLLGACAGQTRLDSPPRMISSDLWASQNFRDSHPDLKHRLAGQAAFEDEDFAQARIEFLEAARFGDKLSQAMLAEMNWQGVGGAPDPVRAYIWMDLAAERGFVGFVSKRERYWAALNPTERELVALLGEPIQAQYGDRVALPNLRMKFRRGLAGSILARTGSTGNATVIYPGAGPVRLLGNAVGSTLANGGIQMEMASYYDRDLWRIDRYVLWNDKQLDLARRAMVEVGVMQSVPEPVTN
jgi:hypothetical protein